MTKSHRTTYLALALTLGAAWLSGCSEDRSTALQDALAQTSSDNADALAAATFAARFDPANGIIPFPNNLLFSGSTDYTVNIPYEVTDSDAAVKEALNALDGFSTVAPLTADFSAAIDATSITPATVRVFELTVDSAGAPNGVTKELTYGVDFVASVTGDNNTTLAILPLKTLQPKDTYMVVLTKGIKAQSGASARADVSYAIAKSDESLVNGTNSAFPALNDAQAEALEPVRQLVSGTETLAAAYTTLLDSTDTIADLAKDDIVLSWTFNTQSEGDVLSYVYATAQTTTPANAINPTPVTTSLLGKADIYVGTLTVPYYLSDTSNAVTDPLTKHWQGAGGSNLTRYNPTPEATGTQTIPMLLSIPHSGSKPSGGWPVVIFQHGVTGNRTNMLAIADTLADAGFAVVAIDLPLHGLIGDEADVGALRAATDAMGASERTFDLDLVTQNASGSITAYIPDGVIDSSGRHFINLISLLTSRDNVRQAVADLFSLTRAVPALDYDGGGADFNSSRMYFVGHSLGAIVGSIYLAKDTHVRDAVLAMPGGGIAKLLDGSPAFGPEIAAGLAALGITEGSAAYETFIVAAQTVMDSADPINYASAAASGRGILLYEVVGNGAGNLPDQVIPNSVWPTTTDNTAPSPTAGTTPLATAMGLTHYGDAVTGSTDLAAWVEFSAGHHSSILVPTNAAGDADASSAAVTAQMQGAMAAFVVSDGTTLNIDSSSGVITAVP